MIRRLQNPRRLNDHTVLIPFQTLLRILRNGFVDSVGRDDFEEEPEAWGEGVCKKR